MTMTCECANCQPCQGCGHCDNGCQGDGCFDPCNNCGCTGCGECTCQCKNECFNQCGVSYHVWIGLEEPNGDSQYTWSDGTAYDYQIWAPGGQNDPSNSRCTVLIADQDTSLGSAAYQHWYNAPCSTTARSFVCKKAARTISY